ncbi:lyase family protein [Amnibacterium sp. CER49]|uniref:lyase family protein n=1 Tax=Amnibacterium sp. CER49 TaxID=3039161 RepID=UPI002448E7A1|nr:lyase family protein [Amnibacterium sp. CER49]MDH2443186.1 lyase family protein [Amnibacterium sp. CER49]
MIDVGLLDPATGDAAELVGDAAYAAAMIEVEVALLGALADVGAAPAVEIDPAALAGTVDVAAVARECRGGGNPVIPLLGALRPLLPGDVRDVLHLGATSQDVLDSATMLVAARVRERVAADLAEVRAGLAALADAHRGTAVAGRTLGQQAAPTVFGLRIAVLLDGIDRAGAALAALELPAQLGGSVGSVAVLADVLGQERAAQVRRRFAERLGLTERAGVWHVERGPVASLAAALAILLGALGRLGLEVAQGARSELGELDLALDAGEGGSSAMPQKRNPVAAVLLVAAGRRAPGLAATVLGAQLALDDRPAGDWHAEWQPLRELLRLAVESAALARGLVPALAVAADRMAANLDATDGAIHAERAQWALVPAVGRARAAALVRDALATGEAFVPALLRLVEGDPEAAPAVERLRAVTASGGPVGLSDALIDASIGGTR